MVEIQLKYGHFVAGALGVNQGLLKAVFQKPAVRQSGQCVVIGQMFAGGDLIFQQGENHSDCHQVLRNVPHFGVDFEGRGKSRQQDSGREDGPPQHEAANRRQHSSAAAPVTAPILQGNKKIQPRQVIADAQAGSSAGNSPRDCTGNGETPRQHARRIKCNSPIVAAEE